MSDRIKLEELQAKMWISDVKNEIDIVNGILKKVGGVLSDVPGDDDTIYQGIRKISGTLSNVWTKMISGFKEATDLIKTSIEKTSAAATELAQDAENLNRKLDC